MDVNTPKPKRVISPLIRVPEPNPLFDAEMPEALRKLVRAWRGDKPLIALTADQAAKAAYLVAAHRPCYVCAVNQPFVIGKLQVERLGKWLVYGVCRPCYLEHGHDTLKQLAAVLFEEDSVGGVTVMKSKAREELGV